MSIRYSPQGGSTAAGQQQVVIASIPRKQATSMR